MKTICDFFASLKFIFMPDYWLMSGYYCKAADKKLLKLAETNDFEPIEKMFFDGKIYHVKLGDCYYWVANYPYYFLMEKHLESVSPHGFVRFKTQNNDLENPRPSRLTISRLHKKLVADLDKHGLVHA